MRGCSQLVSNTIRHVDDSPFTSHINWSNLFLRKANLKIQILCLGHKQNHINENYAYIFFEKLVTKQFSKDTFVPVSNNIS
jgi:hypothetical protein